MGIWFPIQILFNIWLPWHLAFLPSILNSKHSAFHHYCASSRLVMLTAFQKSCTKHRNVKPSGSFNTGKLWQVETLYLPISKYFQTTCWIEWLSSRIRKCFGLKVLEGKSHYTSRPSPPPKKKNILLSAAIKSWRADKKVNSLQNVPHFCAIKSFIFFNQWKYFT